MTALGEALKDFKFKEPELKTAYETLNEPLLDNPIPTFIVAGLGIKESTYLGEINIKNRQERSRSRQVKKALKRIVADINAKMYA